MCTCICSIQRSLASIGKTFHSKGKTTFDIYIYSALTGNTGVFKFSYIPDLFG